MLHVTYLPFFRSMSDSNCLYSAISVRMVGNNSLVHLLRILTSLELFFNNEFYSRHPVLTNVYNNGKTVLGEKLFCSFESVFELNRGLRDSQTSINNKDLGLLVKKEAENICKDNIWSSFLCVLALSYDQLTNSFILCFLWVSKISENV